MNASARSVLLRVLLSLVMFAGLSIPGGCAEREKTDADAGDEETEESAPQDESTAQPGYDSWVVYINDDDTYTEGGITYSIALNLTATNPTQDIAGTYTGSATAKTDTTGDVGGLPLNASAIANSSTLEFTLAEGFDSADGALAPVTSDELVYSGSGSIVMQAAGSGTIGPAGGGFSNTSGQRLTITTQGSAVTLSVDISGHTYTFEGTLSGE